MKSISSHVLDGVRGSDAIGLRVSAYRLAATGEKSKIVEVQTDRSGRLTIEVDPCDDDSETRYEFVFHSRAYFAEHALDGLKSPIHETVIRLDLSEVETCCHVPIIMSPHTYSTWWSSSDR